MDATGQGVGLEKESQEYTGTFRDMWELHGWKSPISFLHSLVYYGDTKRYVRILSSILTVVVDKSPRFLGHSSLYKYVLNWLPRRYHGKVLTMDHAKQILTLNRDVDINPEEAKRVLTYDMVNQIVMKSPGTVAIGDCSCRMRKENPCQPIHVCMFIGEPFASFAVAHGKDKLNIHYATQEEALDVLRQAHEAGYVHNAFFKDAAGDRLFALCNCCSCCCGGVQVANFFQDFFEGDNPELKMLESSGYVAVHNPEHCQSCGTCMEICNFKALFLNESHIPQVDVKRCLGCGLCVDKCQAKAIHLERDFTKAEPLDLSVLDN